MVARAFAVLAAFLWRTPTISSSIVLLFSTFVTNTPSPSFGYIHTLSGVDSLDTLRPRLTHIVTHLFRDDDCWPLGSSLFCMGPLLPLLPPNHSPSSLSGDSHRLLTRVAHSLSAIQLAANMLAANIMGMVLRHYGSTVPSPSSGQAVGVQASRPSFVLPSHLQHLLHS